MAWDGDSEWVDAIIKAIENIELDLGANRAHRIGIQKWMKKNEPGLWSSQKFPDKTIQSYLQQEHFGFKSVYGKEERRGYYTLLDFSLPSAPTIPPPAAPGSNTGHPAELIVGDFIQRAGWNVSYVSRTNCGYDLEAKRMNTAGVEETRHVEVKSSIGKCTPELTENEWDTAKRVGSTYWLAIVPNFSAGGPSTIYWIQDPFNTVKPVPHSTKRYRINSKAWKPHSKGF